MNLADALNLGCMCQTLSPDRLREQLETDPSLAGLTRQLAASHPHLFSETAVFLDAGTRDALAATVSAIERVIALPAYQDFTLAPCAGHRPAPVRAGRCVHGLRLPHGR